MLLFSTKLNSTVHSGITQQQQRNATRSVIGQKLFFHVSITAKIKIYNFIYNRLKIQQTDNALAHNIFSKVCYWQ